MAGQDNATGTVQLSKTITPETSRVPRLLTWLVWTLFGLSVGTLVAGTLRGYEWGGDGVVVIDGLTALMWVVVTFFSAIVHSYSRRYMAGDSDLERFFAGVFAFTLAVMTMAAADHVVLFVAAWLSMGLIMASLIGHVDGWDQAEAAASLARRYFLAGSGLLTVGLALLAWSTGTTAVSGIVERVDAIGPVVGIVAVGSILLAAMIQSALFPFHRWLLSSMTAPTPASALMHAGFVNGGGILLTRFAPVVADDLAVMSVVVLAGAVSALLGQAVLLVQPNVKRKLGSSTVAQMGFMILQCGLGFFAAAITHLVLHGFYKAYLFLSSGGTVEQTAPKATKRRGSSLPGLAVSLLTGVGGGVLFATLTGKGLHLDSGIVLALVVVVTTMHATRDVLGRSSLSPVVRLATTPLVVMTAIGVYGVTFNAISTLLGGVPMASSGTELTAVHVVVGALFVGAYLTTELGLHRSSRRLYVTLLNLSRPHRNTILTRKEDYDDA